jgi:hypothetical protein
MEGSEEGDRGGLRARRLQSVRRSRGARKHSAPIQRVRRRSPTRSAGVIVFGSSAPARRRTTRSLLPPRHPRRQHIAPTDLPGRGGRRSSGDIGFGQQLGQQPPGRERVGRLLPARSAGVRIFDVWVNVQRRVVTYGIARRGEQQRRHGASNFVLPGRGARRREDSDVWWAGSS